MWLWAVGAIVLGIVLVEVIRKCFGARAIEYGALAMTLLGAFAGFVLADVAANKEDAKRIESMAKGVVASSYLTLDRSLKIIQSDIKYTKMFAESGG